MESISDIVIIGMDEHRPPRILKQPYIDLIFKLNHQAPADWCDEFNGLMSQYESKPCINTKEGLYIETWVRTPGEIVPHLQLIQTAIADCIALYVEKIAAKRRSASKDHDQPEENSEQSQLNKIIAGLNFGAKPSGH